ncbi:ImmA/IrrE family metallo-endopeptidase [Limnoglobus roseus]|uniref:ImmA/IrrE family metallo-endopeptidase n=1 Tax=Limnoglobus roseus TaxID=2598579 RepID=A0A5C1AD84_9BACT|nr:ImmA/IrrE family metallo-endopeptidase [Limnoglobus roseus]QEL16605.1 ImmA/IrrE family metallo-endopeptidase [Limnoglobus roseus]
MTLPELEHIAAEVWLSFDGPPPPPRDLEPHLSLIAPLFVVTLPRLSPSAVFEWLRDRGLPLPDRDPPPMNLLGCLVAHAGSGGIFLEESLTADERRVIVAHEFAHFVLDYEGPRTRAVRRLGPDILRVLDGFQPPDDSIEIAAALADVPLGVHSHLLDCDAETEDRATALALELLAPRAAVRGGEEELVTTWQIPRRWAVIHARWIADWHQREGNSLVGKPILPLP